MMAEGKGPRSKAGDARDIQLMREALRLAEIALGRGDPPVGAVVFCQGRAVGEGIEAVRSEKDFTAHAELKAIREACRTLDTLDLAGCVLYTTVEPCFMCSFIIRKVGVSRVVSGKAENRVGGISSKHPILIDPTIPGWPLPPQVATGVLEDECLALFARCVMSAKSTTSVL
jgi:tRNA(adenine34) deaminase